MNASNHDWMESAYGRFRLHRLPRRRREWLRAWDAADVYLLDDLHRETDHPQPLLLVNDAFGALAVALHAHAPVSWSDSWLAHRAVAENLLANGLPEQAVQCLDSLHTPVEAGQVLIKLPKSLALFEDQLLRLKPRLTEESRLRVAGLQRHMPRRVWELLERIIGPTETLPGWRKAKLIRVRVDPSLPLPANPYPLRYRLEEENLELLNHAAVFSRSRLDLGTRFLLEHLPVTQGPGDVIDLGCGNGVIGLIAALRNPEARVHFVDESYMAVASARENLHPIDPDQQRTRFIVGNALDDFEPASADLVLCNPPFHQQQAVADTVVRRMIRQTAAILRPEGEFWLVANRHLDYKSLLKRYFGGIEIPASNRRFTVYRAIASR